MATLLQLQAEAATLPVADRAALATYLIHGLPEADAWVSDEEVAERARQIDGGEVTLMSMQELREGVIRDRAGK